jgi:2-succinyl-6-hydroxy-2,4-cyclohexadiene-1-carboxylate synthase
VPLHVEVRGTGPPLVLLHGFTQTGRLWGRFGELVGRGRTVVAVDLPGHGGSADMEADLPGTAALVASAVLGAVGPAETCDVVGYSLGARVGLQLLVGTDLAVRRLAVVGASGGIEDSEERERRRRSDASMARELEASGDLGAFVDAWLRRPMFERLTRVGAAGMDERLGNTARGLASSLRSCGAGAQAPIWDRLSGVDPPVLAIAGTDDTRYAAHALRLSRLVRRAAASLVPGGGHAAHLAQPEHTARLIGHWFAGTPGAADLTATRPR